MTKRRLTWGREPRRVGLAGTCQGELGYDLNVNGIRVACVRPQREGGYYWWAREDVIGIWLRNTSQTPVPTIEEAKTACRQYVERCLAEWDRAHEDAT